MSELKCPCHLRDDMELDDCDSIDCNDCCPLMSEDDSEDENSMAKERDNG